jgi:hypothetical protein
LGRTPDTGIGFSPVANLETDMSQTNSEFEQLCGLFNYSPKSRPLTNHEVADMLQVSYRTVDGWRCTGEGPRYFQPKGTRRVWYSEVDVLRWMAAGSKQSTSEAA